MSNTETPPTPTPAPTPTRRARADQDQDLANRISQHQAAILFAKTHPVISSMMQTRSYDSDEFDNGLNLCESTQDKFTLRQVAIATEGQNNADAQSVENVARSGFIDFRKIGRVVLKKNLAAHSALQLNGRVSSDIEIFLTMAETSYTTALATPDYLTALSKRGFNITAIQAELANLEALRQARLAQTSAQAAAKQATLERDAAAKLLDEWWAEFRAVARVALKEHPSLLRELGL